MTHSEIQVHNDPRCAPATAANAPTREGRLLRRQSREILEEHLDRLLTQLDRPESVVDTSSVRETLLDLSADIGARTSIFRSSDYRWVLERLTGIYARGFGRHPPDPLVTTAAAYGQVIETISNAYPDQDYREAVGQLFCYMSRLFRTREGSWKAVYRHILSIPDAVEAKQLLNRALFVEIQEWAEAGVENLFSIRGDLYERIEELATAIEELERRIFDLAQGPGRLFSADTRHVGPNVIDMEDARKKRLLRSLERERKGLVAAWEEEKSVVALVESDIREFEDKLRSTRRAYFVRPV